jgi:predicted dehydrogenase
MKRIAVFGMGRRWLGMVPKYRDLGLYDRELQFVGGYDIDPERARRTAAEAGIDVPIYENPSRMLEELQPDAVVITSYDAAHLENFRALAGHDVPVLIEKPLETTVEKAAEIVRLASARTTPVMAAHNMRFSPILQRAHQMIGEGVVGQIHSFRFHNNVHYGHGYFRSWMRQKKNVGELIIEKGAHDLDILHMLTGSLTTRITCSAKRFAYGGKQPDNRRCSTCPDAADCPDELAKVYFNVLGSTFPNEIRSKTNDLCVHAETIDTHDDFVCLVELQNGCHGTYVQTLFTPYSYHSRIYTLVGSNGVMEINLDETEGDITVYPRYGSKKEYRREHFDYHGRSHYNADHFMVRHFYEVICGRTKPACTVKDGYHAVAATTAAVQSAEERRPVDVQEFCK